MCSALGYRVQHLRRVRIINIDLGTLASGEWRELAEAEVAELLPRRRPASGGVRPPQRSR
jgi:16S rRNA U516 pseudouridylate synthase RsuA-like enzyme